MDQFVLISRTVRCITSFRRVNTFGNADGRGIEVITVEAGRELLQSFIFLCMLPPPHPSSSSSSSALQCWWETQSTLQPAADTDTKVFPPFFLNVIFLSFLLLSAFHPTCGFYPFPAPATAFDTRVTEQISCKPLWLHRDFCSFFFSPINTHTRIRHTCLSARHTPDSVKRRHYWRGRPRFPRQEKMRRKTVLPLFKQLT